ncbi:uncharacterized protein LOC131428229 [Malaya genurostris]|uniref:uncharacterized protein LOC131428229 n=1 Tax=Malaya genurostris TaxID=325434 RepID=UPI0026F38951|nr:uncharacterized protein LOC131428229 [Malaya genurostris]
MTRSEPFPEGSSSSKSSTNHNGPHRNNTHVKLKAAQIVLGLLVLVLVRPRFRDANIEYFQIFVAFNSTLLTALLLCNKVRRSLELDRVFRGLELYYTGTVATLYYSTAFGMLLYYVGYYNPRTNILAGLVGLLAGFVYGHNWLLLYREQVLTRLATDCCVQELV